VQARPELSDGFKERQIACIERTMGFHVAWMIHIYLYAASRLWDTDRISRLRRLPLKRRAITHFGKNLPLPAGRSVERVHDAGVGRRFDRAAIRRAKHVALFLRSSRKSNTCFLTVVSGRVVGNPSLTRLRKGCP